MNYFLAVFVVLLFWAAIPIPRSYCGGAVEVQVQSEEQQTKKELDIIEEAAARNGCRTDDFIILLAIRQAENGRPGREFGIKHRRCEAEMAKRPAETLSIQAGWAAATIVKNRQRWEQAGRPGEFIDYLADRYCPVKTDPQGHENWKVNVKYFYKRLKME